MTILQKRKLRHGDRSSVAWPQWEGEFRPCHSFPGLFPSDRCRLDELSVLISSARWLFSSCNKLYCCNLMLRPPPRNPVAVSDSKPCVTILRRTRFFFFFPPGGCLALPAHRMEWTQASLKHSGQPLRAPVSRSTSLCNPGHPQIANLMGQGPG